MAQTEQSTIDLNPKLFIKRCLIAAQVILLMGFIRPFPTWVLALEVLSTVLLLFVLGSAKYRLDKNALTYGMGLIVIATFIPSWWPESGLRAAFLAEGAPAFATFFYHNFLTLHGLERLFHADTMLFILGLTFFVAAISQTRLLESASFAILKRNKGRVVPTLLLISALVSLLSGILDGVSMIGLMIRTTVIILLLSKTNGKALIYCVTVSTVITTVCGMWLAYGEPPNLIMKTNLMPHLNDAFFLNYLAPAAIGCFLIVAWNMRSRLKGRTVKIDELDVMERNIADVRFLQAMRHGEVLDGLDFVETHQKRLGAAQATVRAKLLEGHSLGEALVRAQVSVKDRRHMLGEYVAEDLAEPLDQHFEEVVHHRRHQTAALETIQKTLHRMSAARRETQARSVWAFLPFIGLLIAHAVNHEIPLFVSSTAGFFFAFASIYRHKKIRQLTLHNGLHEYKEYLFLFPLFLSITLLQRSGFFTMLAAAIHHGIAVLGVSHVAETQFVGATVLSAILDNNVVADFAGRALQGLSVKILHFFAMAQIAGYALGGCWTHIGSAQSVVAFSFIHKEINDRYTPFEWIKDMTPVILQMAAFVTVYVYLRGMWLGR